MREEFFGLRGVRDAVDADVNHGGAGTNVIRRDHRGASHGGDNDIGAADGFRRDRAFSNGRW